MTLEEMKAEVELARIAMETHFREPVVVERDPVPEEGYTTFEFKFPNRLTSEASPNADTIGMIVHHDDPDLADEVITGCYPSDGGADYAEMRGALSSLQLEMLDGTLFGNLTFVDEGDM